MNDKDNAKYWNEYHNLKERADLLMKRQRRNLEYLYKTKQMDDYTWCDVWRATYDQYEKDPAVLEFNQRFAKAYPKRTWWQKVFNKIGIWDEKYITGPNEEMECLACGLPLKNKMHEYQSCSTDIIYKRYIYRKGYKSE